jgi:hypothetical protein
MNCQFDYFPVRIEPSHWIKFAVMFCVVATPLAVVAGQEK